MRKNPLLIILTVALCFFALQLTAFAEQDITVFLNGTEVVFDQPPVLESGRTLVPVRAVMEALGLTLSYDEDTNIVSGTAENISIIMEIDNVAASVNNETVTLDVPPKIINGRTLVPLRFLGDSLGLKVEWNQDAYEVTLTSESGGNGAPITSDTVETTVVPNPAKVDDNTEPAKIDDVGSTGDIPEFKGFFTDEEEIAGYLARKFPSITLGGEKFSFEYSVIFPASADCPADYRIELSYRKRLVDRINGGTVEQKQSDSAALKDFMGTVAADLIKIAPAKKFTGRFNYYESISLLSSISYDDCNWTNYGDIPLYEAYNSAEPTDAVTWQVSKGAESLFEQYLIK